MEVLILVLCSSKKVFCKYAVNLWGEHPFRSAISIKCPVFAEHLWRRPLGDCFLLFYNLLKHRSGNSNDETNVKLIKLSWLTSKLEN